MLAYVRTNDNNNNHHHHFEWRALSARNNDSRIKWDGTEEVEKGSGTKKQEKNTRAHNGTHLHMNFYNDACIRFVPFVERHNWQLVFDHWSWSELISREINEMHQRNVSIKSLERDSPHTILTLSLTLHTG